MPLLAVLANPHAEARAAMRPARVAGSESLLRLVRMSPKARTEISSALRTAPLKVDVSGKHGEFVRFRLKDPKGYQSFALIVLAPKHLRGLTPTEARSKLGTPGLRRLTLGVIGRKGPGRSELQSVLVPKSRVSAVAQKYLKRAAVANGRVMRNVIGPMVAGGVAAGVAGAVVNRILRNPVNPLTKAESADILRQARTSGEAARFTRAPHREYFLGRAAGKANVVDLYGPRKMHKRAWAVERAARRLAVSGSKLRVIANRVPTGTVIDIPFREGRKYKVESVVRWVEEHGTPEMKERMRHAMAQYKRFHKGKLPEFITYHKYKIGSHKGISDVEFGVSEGREWMAAYQVPRSSGKWMDKASAGRYVHAHGDSDIEVDVKRPVKLSKLPQRFHTPDGKSVGVIPSRNVKIGEWYEG
jgi:hypothetical protein